MKEIIQELSSIYECIFNGITNNQAIEPYSESIYNQLNLLHSLFQAVQKQQDLKQYKLGRIYAWTALLKTLEETLSNLNDIRKLTNTIYSTKARKPKKQKRSK